MFKAYLAEPYDGIGQYVMVALSRAGVTKAMRGRIASGDFGGSRTFPEGTPVVVISNRGQLEVLLGNIPNPCWEPFNRVESVGTVGIGPDGLPWTVFPSGVASVSVNGSELVFD